jgi:ribosomal protein S18 acetylase RimI-like enzyme
MTQVDDVTVRLVEDVEPCADAIWSLLEIADGEFVPPLSTRTGTEQRQGLDERSRDDLTTFFEACLDHEFLLAEQADDVVGFLSFHDGYEIEELQGYVPSNYVSTVVVHPDHRRKGYARQLYQHLFEALPPAVEQPYVTTRTWGTNDSHIALLEEFGFETLSRVPDDRGPGIDTVYFGRATEQKAGNSNG